MVLTPIEFFVLRTEIVVVARALGWLIEAIRIVVPISFCLLFLEMYSLSGRLNRDMPVSALCFSRSVSQTNGWGKRQSYYSGSNHRRIC